MSALPQPVGSKTVNQQAPPGQPDDDWLWSETGCRGVLFRPVPRDKSHPFQNAISVDLEDWQQSVFDRRLPVSDRYLAGTAKVLDLLDRFGIGATFFVLGNLADRDPALIREIDALGHEVQLHGYDHTEVTAQTRYTFRQSLLRSKGSVEDAIGREVTGFRAPRFSIVATSLWALDVLAECGFRYDSSIFPTRIRGYGIKDWPRYEHWLRTPAGAELIEVPVATLRCLGRTLPFGGSGYFRLMPHAVIRLGLRRLERRGMPAVLYFHPHEFDPDAWARLNLRIPWKVRLHQVLGRRGFAAKIHDLLDEFPFGPIRDLLPAGPIGPRQSRPIASGQGARALGA